MIDPLISALEVWQEKGILPTELNTFELRELSAALRAQSFFSAQTTQEYLLEKYKEKIAGILNPVKRPGESTTQYSPAYVKQAIQDLLAENGYEPNPEHQGTLKDLSSDARIDLVIKTNVQLAQGQGYWLRSQKAVVLDLWPGQELFRAESRAHTRDWLQRWRTAGQQTGNPMGTGWTITKDGRMIALKNHDIWAWIGSSALFNDALDVVWPPFAFNSGMWVRDVEREEVEAIGLLAKGAPAPKPANIAATFKTFAEKLKAL